MPLGSKRRRSEIVDNINAALEIVDEVSQDGDGDLVRAVVASFALKQISEGNYEDDREDDEEDQAPEEDEEEEPVGEEDEEPEAPEDEPGGRRRGRAGGRARAAKA
jgi:hypothetical protein